MNATELARAVAEKAGVVNQAQARAVVEAFCDVVTEQVGAGGDVRLLGFGTFTSVVREASTGRNPSNGEAIQIPAKRHPKFKVGATFKKAVS